MSSVQQLGVIFYFPTALPADEPSSFLKAESSSACAFARVGGAHRSVEDAVAETSAHIDRSNKFELILRPETYR